MRLKEPRPYADAEVAARKIVEIANAVEVIQDGRIYIEKINGPMIYVERATPGEYRAGLARAITNGWLQLHESGTYVKFSDVLFYPKPAQKPHPPLWIGGESPPALRRTIKFADAWYPGNNSQTKPLDTPERLAAGIADVKRACAAAGRDPATLGVALLVQGFFEWGDYRTADGSARRLFTGTSTDMAADATALSSLGVSHVALRLGGNTAQECVARIERFGVEVIAKMKR